MIKAKKWMAATLSAMFLAVFPLTAVGCANDPLSEYANRPQTVTVEVFDGGYGIEWITEVAKYYMDNVDAETYVDIKKTVLNEEETSKLEAGISTYDMYLLDNMYNNRFYFEDLSDLMDEYPTGESDKTIREKMGDYLYGIYSEDDGSIMQVPWHNQQGYSFAYNKTTIDDALGKDNWELPRTTDEFFELGDRLMEKNVYLFAASYGDQEDYTKRGIQVWFAQMLGEEAFEYYINGYAKNTNDTTPDDPSDDYYFSENAPDLISQNEDAHKAMYEVIKTLNMNGNGYIHSDSTSMTFMDLESAFVGFGFGRNLRKPAFIFNGPWLESELEGSDLLDLIASEGKPQEIRAMKMPIVSDIISRTPSIKVDRTLREVISYVDGDRETVPDGVTPEDVAIIAEARRMVAQVTSGTLVIPKAAKNKEGAKEFLKFMTSDAAQQVTIEVKNGLSMLPYGYEPKQEDLKSDFVRDLYEINRDAIYIERDWKAISDFSYYTGFSLNNISGDLNADIASRQPNDVKTAQTYYDELFTYFSNRWGDIIADYRNAVGTIN